MESKTRLRDPRFLRTFLRDQSRNGPAAFRLALREAARAQKGGLSGLSRRTGLARTGLSKALSEDGNPSFATICKILDGLGMDIEIEKKPEAPSITRRVPTEGVNAGPSAPSKMAGSRIEPGSAKGMTFYMAEDFDEPLAEFADSM